MPSKIRAPIIFRGSVFVQRGKGLAIYVLFSISIIACENFHKRNLYKFHLFFFDFEAVQDINDVLILGLLKKGAKKPE